MSLRGRFTLMAVAIVGAILSIGSLTCFIVMRSELRSQVDDSLRVQGRLVQQTPAIRDTRADELFRRLPQTPRRLGAAAPYAQFVTRAGHATRPTREELRLPLTARDLAIARSGRGGLLEDRQAEGVHVRLITVPVKGRGAIQLARSLVSVDDSLARLRTVLIALVIGGTAVALGASRLLSRSTIAPIRQLTAATERIEATGDLGLRVETNREDEVGRLAKRFNAMLARLERTQAALESSTEAQRQLVADASHELRTPIASLRTNIEVLIESGRIDDADRSALLRDVVEQTDELSTIVADLIELARGDQPPDHVEELDLGEIARESMERARRHAPSIAFQARIEPWPMHGSPERLGRAINNLLDNAAKFSPPGSAVELTVAGGTVTVRDHGPGVAPDDLPHMFDRFWRGRASREVPGSGLGLAIVKQVAEGHGGDVRTHAADDGGLVVELQLASANGAPAPVQRA